MAFWYCGAHIVWEPGARLHPQALWTPNNASLRLSMDLADVYHILSPCKLGRLCIPLVMKTPFPFPLGDNPKKKTVQLLIIQQIRHARWEGDTK